MAYDLYLSERIMHLLALKGVDFEMKKMMGGLTFMVDNKMCIGIMKENLMARVGPTAYESSLEKPFVSEMTFTNRSLKGYIYVHPQGIIKEEELSYWIDVCLAYNPHAKASKKKKKKE